MAVKLIYESRPDMVVSSCGAKARMSKPIEALVFEDATSMVVVIGPNVLDFVKGLAALVGLELAEEKDH